ncbi:MAG: hypothetical protein ACFFD4_01595 [Candidatus Odinarchaeota archaeon]
MDLTPEFLIAAALTVFFAILFALFLYQTLKRNRRAYILTTGIFFGILAGLITAIIELQLFPDWGSELLRIELIVWALMYGCLYLFLEETETTSPNGIRFSIVITLFTGFLVFSFISLHPEAVNMQLDLWWDFFYNGLGVFIFGFGIYSFFKTYLFGRELEPLVQSIGMVFVVAGFCLSFYGDLTGESLGILADALKIVGLLVFIAVFILRIDFIYRLPIEVFSIAIYTNTGFPIYIARSKHAREIETIDHTLLAGMFQALNNIIQNATGSISTIKELSSKDRVITFYSSEKVTVAAVVDRSTHFLENALMGTALLIEKRYSDELGESVLDTSRLTECASITADSFPFLVLEPVKENERI